jgi:hypothetical protein
MTDTAWITLTHQLVIAEAEGVLTRTDHSPEDAAAIEAAIGNSAEETRHTIAEMGAIASEAVFRLAALRHEDPRATLEWIFTTEWQATT